MLLKHEKCDRNGSKITIFSKKITKNCPAAGPQTPVCDTFGTIVCLPRRTN